jgi:hypothetical protein
MRSNNAVVFFVSALCFFAVSPAGADDLKLQLCLSGSKDPEEVRMAKAACTSYLAELMGNVRFGVVTPAQMARPFCLPNRDLTDEEHIAVFRRFRAANPQMPELKAMELDGVIKVKAFKCNSN